jgi:hypothetical protein
MGKEKNQTTDHPEYLKKKISSQTGGGGEQPPAHDNNEDGHGSSGS